MKGGFLANPMALTNVKEAKVPDDHGHPATAYFAPLWKTDNALKSFCCESSPTSKKRPLATTTVAERIRAAREKAREDFAFEPLGQSPAQNFAVQNHRLGAIP